MLPRIATFAIVLAILLSAIVPGSATANDERTRVDVVYAAGAGDDEPVLAAREADRLLSELGGLRNVRLVPTTDAASFLEVVRSSRAPILVIFAHGSATGVSVAGTPLGWDTVRGAIAQSEARDVFLGSCDSALMLPIDGKTIRTAFRGAVDVKVVAPQIASDLFLDVLPSLDPRFLPQFTTYVEQRGGIERYAELILFPEQALQSDEERCRDLMTAWYAGEEPRSSGECIFTLDPANINCYSPAERRTEVCTSSSATEQEVVTQEASAAMSASETDPEEPGAADQFSTAWWDKMRAKLAPRLPATGNPGEWIRIEGGPGQLECFTVVKLEDFAAGGLSAALRAMLKRLAEIAEPDDFVNSDVDGSVLSLRICGSYNVYAALTVDGEARFGGAGDLEGRLSLYFEASINVFRWSLVSIAFEGGFAVPTKVSMDGRVQFCPNSRALTAKVSAPVSFGPGQLFYEGNWGWREFGDRADLTGKKEWSFETIKRCPNGYSPFAATIDPRIPELELDTTLARLIDAGIAVVNERPTILSDDGTTSHILQSGFISYEPGTAEWNGAREDGILDALGVPADLDRGLKVLVDVTDPAVLRALGRDVTDPPIPRVSLANGIAILPVGVPTNAALEAFCTGHVTDGQILHADACAGVVTGPIPQPFAQIDLLFGTPAVGGVVRDLRAARDAIRSATEDACAMSATAAEGCSQLFVHESGLAAAEGGIDLLAEVHSMMVLLDRGAQSVTGQPLTTMWFLTSCNAAVGPFAPEIGSGGATLDLVPIVQPDGTVRMGKVHWTTCMEAASGETDLMDLRELEAQFLLGNTLLATYATAANERRAETLDDDPMDVPDVVGELDPVMDIVIGVACGDLDLCGEGSP